MKEFNNLFVEPTEKTPQIDFNRFTGELILSGKSIPENANTLYEPVYNWVSEYVPHARQTTNLRLNMEYFNTSTSIWQTKILKVLSKIKNPDCVLIVHLYFSIEEFDEMDVEDLKDTLFPITDIFIEAIPSISIKVYGVDDDNKIIKSTVVFI